MKLNLSKRKINQIYFIFFILLNVADFYGISGDIDFFKKILSWIIIGYLFYVVSPTKIFIGIRDKLFDFLFIISFSLMTIIKSIALYLKDYNPKEFYIFHILLNFLNQFNPTNLIIFCFFLGSLSTIILTIFLLKKHPINKDSLIGSLNLEKYLNEYLQFIHLDFFLLVLFEFFFVLTIFNFFMEWFAIAVDAIILVLGLIYYFFLYLHKHTKINTNYLEKVTNTGNDFFQNLIKTFSNKKTIFIGFGFILTLHLLVDGGAFLIPYSVGTGSSLYFNSLDKTGTSHTPIFNLKTFSNSLIFKDISKIFTENKNLLNATILTLPTIFIYLLALFVFFSLLILPFYIYSKNIKNEKINLNNKYTIFLLSSIIFILLLNIIYPVNYLSNPLNSKKIINFVTIPLGIERINPTSSISGIDIYTNSIYSNYDGNQLLFAIILFLVILFFIAIRYKKYKIFFNKILYTFILLFFILYITIFFISSIDSSTKPTQKTTQNLKNNFTTIYKNIYLNQENFHIKIRKPFQINSTEIYLEFFANKPKTSSDNHQDFILIKIKNPTNQSNQILATNTNTKIFLNNTIKTYEDSSKLLLFNSENNFKNIIILLGTNKNNLSKNINSILGEYAFSIKKNYLTLDFKNENDNSFIFNYNTNNNKKLLVELKKEEITKNSKKDIANTIKIFREIVSSIFYILGIIFFIYFYTKKNLLPTKKIN